MACFPHAMLGGPGIGPASQREDALSIKPNLHFVLAIGSHISNVFRITGQISMHMQAFRTLQQGLLVTALDILMLEFKLTKRIIVIGVADMFSRNLVPPLYNDQGI